MNDGLDLHIKIKNFKTAKRPLQCTVSAPNISGETQLYGDTIEGVTSNCIKQFLNSFDTRHQLYNLLCLEISQDSLCKNE
jgi:hypothetical protein